MEKIRLLLADDHMDVLNSLATRLTREPRIDVVGEAANSAQAIALTLTAHPHVLLIDPMMRDGLGMNAIRQIAMRCPETGIVVLTAVVDTAFQIELRKLGVNRVLIKGLSSIELLSAIEEVAHINSREQEV